jgi:hypothetical protein
MTELGIWNVTNGTPKRFERGQVELEKQLEAWIEQEPTLIQAGLSIVGRQVRLKGGILDLLGLDPLGRWVVIEIKRGNVRRETVTQAIDYASCLNVDEMSTEELKALVQKYLAKYGRNLKAFLKDTNLNEQIFDEREILIYVVGTGRDPDLKRMTKEVSFQNNQISVVNFEVFETEGERLILRQLTELDTQPASQPTLPRVSTPSAKPPATNDLQRLFALADKNGVGDAFRLIYDAATKHGLYPRLHKWSIMYTPPNNKTRVLLCAWVKPVGGHLDFYTASDVFAEFYPVSFLDTLRILGLASRGGVTMDEVKQFILKLDKLFAKIAKNS